MLLPLFRPAYYAWNTSGEGAAGGLRIVVTWTLTPTKAAFLARGKWLRG
jgi:hypothetical protein